MPISKYAPGANKPPVLKEFSTTLKNLEVLRKVLLRMRDEWQGGFTSRHDGRWSFASSGLPQTTPEELDALMDLAGITPDEIKSKGSCKNCIYSIRGRERGWDMPCSWCSRPMMSNYLSRRSTPERLNAELIEIIKSRDTDYQGYKTKAGIIWLHGCNLAKDVRVGDIGELVWEFRDRHEALFYFEKSPLKDFVDLDLETEVVE